MEMRRGRTGRALGPMRVRDRRSRVRPPTQRSGARGGEREKRGSRRRKA